MTIRHLPASHTAASPIHGRLAVLLALILAASSAPALSQVAPLITDRPDFTESAAAVPVGSFQFEGGLTFEDSGVDALIFGEPLIRYGLRERLELRFGLPSIVSLDDPVDDTGLSDLSVGFKLELPPTSTAWDMAVIGTLSLPTGSDNFTSDTIDPSAIFVASRDISDRLSFATQARGAIEGDDNDAVLEATAVFGYALRENLGGFAEIATRFQDNVDTGVTLHTGVSSLIKELLQVDVHLGFGLTDTAPDFFIGAGLSYRLDR
ncbi:MAG: hypothetical protein COV99_01545 [Bacteroidetes bacterium CG12_big_fil_rev_8_21_14_0_65_60_17]|nr:MAG: hypothetical protein COV99_01545 [Bacteroidetes bacterium CG12_big_fil_rev_8_21_14_0_65_60_17]